MKFVTFYISGPLLIECKKHSDERGFFAEIFRKDHLQSEIGPIEFVQDNHSYSSRAGTVRGLHFQIAPTAQAKLIRVVNGAILDVAVDIRKSSRTHGKHVAVKLSAERPTQLYIPIGFAHGFCTLEENTEVTYKITSYYDPATEKGLAWDDPALNIPWPVKPNEAILSDKDRSYPKLIELGDWFD